MDFDIFLSISQTPVDGETPDEDTLNLRGHLGPCSRRGGTPLNSSQQTCELALRTNPARLRRRPPEGASGGGEFRRPHSHLGRET